MSSLVISLLLLSFVFIVVAFIVYTDDKFGLETYHSGTVIRSEWAVRRGMTVRQGIVVVDGVSYKVDATNVSDIAMYATVAIKRGYITGRALSARIVR